MEQAEIIKILQDAVYTVLICAAPMLITGMVVGVIISIFQATTQINEQTLAFVPKIIAILLAVVIFGGFIITNMTEFTNRMYAMIETVIR